MKTEEILADELLTRIEGTELTIDDLLALLAYSIHENTKPLTGARDEGADIGKVGPYACYLKDRARNALC